MSEAAERWSEMVATPRKAPSAKNGAPPRSRRPTLTEKIRLEKTAKSRLRRSL